MTSTLTPRMMLATTVLLGVCSAWSSAQEPQTGTAEMTQVDALECWRRVDRGAIRVGQPLTMTITCSVVETDQARTVPNEVALQPETIDVTPFEVVNGERHSDIIVGPRRWFQYAYTLSLIGEDHFGADVDIPELVLTYRIERTVDGGSALPGRELTYVLPPEPIRVVSLVPENANDIAGVPGPSFGSVDERRFRASAATLLAAALGVLAIGLLATGVIRARHAHPGRVAARTRPVPDAAIARRAVSELTAVQRQTQGTGWDGGLAARALAGLRLAAAVGVSHPVAQLSVDTPTEARSGQLKMRRGWWRARTTLVSSAITARMLEEEMHWALDGGRHTQPEVAISGAQRDGLRNAIGVFTAARYSADGELPGDDLSRELEQGIASARHLPLLTLAPVRAVRRLGQRVASWWQERWAP